MLKCDKKEGVTLIFLAHISKDKTRRQTIKQHAINTAILSGRFAEAFDCYDWGYACGLMHDIGKFSESFQKRLQGGAITDHATAGAQELQKRNYLFAAYCTAGHHSGLLDGGSKADEPGSGTFWGRMRKRVDTYDAFIKEIEMPILKKPPLQPLEKGGFSASFFIRMLFSCLVDADYLDTEAFMGEQTIERGGGDSIEVLYGRLIEKINPWLEHEDRKTINGRRTQILRHCLEMGAAAQGIYQLSVPTGGGKTVSSLAFALKHAKENTLERIIYVIPYTSIIEQSARIFKDILGSHNVLEHHSNVTFEKEDEYGEWRLAAENWDCPVIVTTNVQFFESLFANKTSKCRKLHNIARSVIIFDEAQMLPTGYLKPCVQVIAELVKNYHCTAVLCTATQPALSSYFPADFSITELCPEIEVQHQFFKRTVIEQIGCITTEALIQRVNKESQVLCILNSRKLVQSVYDALTGEGTYHLSTFMHPVHRKRIIKEIRARLDKKQPCRLIATSLVEAGVDFDFKTVFREMAGVDSVIQAAGRCNREGRHKMELCKTYVFTIDKSEEIRLPNELRLPISVGQAVAEKYGDISAQEAVDEYFTQLYRHRGEGLDKKQIVEAFECESRSLSFPFETVAGKFRFIENDTVTILIDQEPEAKLIAQRLRQGEKSRQLMRDAGMYCVSIYKNQYEALMGAGKLELLASDFYLLRNNQEYTEEMGLVICSSRGDAILDY